jgi:uncharacterized protein YfcZ (UPF0381/DUF406 family)
VFVLRFALLIALFLAGCGGGSPASAPTAAPAAAPTANVVNSLAAQEQPAATAAPAPTNAPTAGVVGGSTPNGTPGPITLGDPSRKIIKDAQMSLEVADIDLALSRVNGIAAQSGGYVLETKTSFDSYNRKTAYIRIAVLVDQFEAALQRLREGASQILSEQASGVDVTQEFVDVQSQIANLEATQARIRQFLEQAKTVEEALKVNAQLTEIEGQLSQLKGRLQFLSQRAAYSTITIELQLPPPATPTPTLTPTPMPTPTREPIWNPEKTTEQASTTLLTIVQSFATLLLWFAIVVLPLALPVILAILIVRWLARRRQRGQPPGE